MDPYSDRERYMRVAPMVLRGSCQATDCVQEGLRTNRMVTKKASVRANFSMRLNFITYLLAH